MKVIIPEGRDTNTPFKRFEKLAKALIAVPKKELDKELEKQEAVKHTRKSTKNHVR